MNQLNPGNTCAHLEIEYQNVEGNLLARMYETQLALQTRLNEVPAEIDNLRVRVPNVLYWKYCIDEEFVELTDWLMGYMTAERQKELRMEYIDMLHFVFNVGIALSVPVEAIEKLELADFIPEPFAANTLARVLNHKHTIDRGIVGLVGLMPWKRWKTYPVNSETKHDAIVQVYCRVLQLFMGMASLLGMNETMVYGYFMAKNKENHARQDRGY